MPPSRTATGVAIEATSPSARRPAKVGRWPSAAQVRTRPLSAACLPRSLPAWPSTPGGRPCGRRGYCAGCGTVRTATVNVRVP